MEAVSYTHLDVYKRQVSPDLLQQLSDYDYLLNQYFTVEMCIRDRYQALIIGTNLGGLGTLIASMASLISFKYMVREDGTLRGSYLAEFTVANLVFLAVLLGVWWI